MAFNVFQFGQVRISWGEPTGQLDRIEEIINAKLTSIAAHVYELRRQVKTMAHTIDDILAAAKAQKTVTDSVVALIASLKKGIEDAIKPSAEQQAKLDEAFDKVTADTDALIGAVNAGTPDELPKDVEAVRAFESTPPEPLVSE